MALATLTSTSTVTGISVESAKEAELPAAEGNHRAARFGVQDRTTTVFVYVFPKTVHASRTRSTARLKKTLPVVSMNRAF